MGHRALLLSTLFTTELGLQSPCTKGFCGSFHPLHQIVSPGPPNIGLLETLKGNGPFTFFAPTDDAFAYLEDGVLGSPLLAETRDS
ncbi:fasciclin domain-containing protein [Sulfitobacter sp. EhC04]|uniref:fasciclin domain-containing protein n=1 Tax=Sulfitobacter sp. EhC04 TaxID=1849168 RepID=UPI0010FE9438|nr:fasciclin domain-containing protein [Sulfitobacter sp. EhC04]